MCLRFGSSSSVGHLGAFHFPKISSDHCASSEAPYTETLPFCSSVFEDPKDTEQSNQCTPLGFLTLIFLLNV